MAIISNEKWQKKNKKEIQQNVEQRMQNYTPAQEPNWDNYLARHNEERRQAATYDPNTGSTVRAVTAENAASTYADSKKKYQSNITQRRTNSAVQLVTDWLDTTSKYLNSGRADEKTRLALSMQHGNITDYLRRWGKDIDPETLTQINKAVERMNAYLDPKTASQAFQSRKDENGNLINGSISAREYDRIKTGNPALDELAGTYMGNFDRYAKENPTQYTNNVRAYGDLTNAEYARSLLSEAPELKRDIISQGVDRAKSYDEASRLANLVNNNGIPSSLTEEEQDEIARRLGYWQNDPTVSKNSRLDVTNGDLNLTDYDYVPEFKSGLPTTSNELGAAFDTVNTNRRASTIQNILDNDAEAATRYYSTYAADRGSLNGSYNPQEISDAATYPEKVTYGYLKETEGEKAARQYWRSLKGDLVQRAARNRVDETQETLRNLAHSVLPIEMWNEGDKVAEGTGNLATQLSANAGTIVGSLASPLTYLPGLDGTRQRTAEMLQFANAVKAQNAQEVAGDNKIARVLWEGASSGIENVVEAAIAGKVADAFGYGAVPSQAIQSANGTMMGEQLLAQQATREAIVTNFVTLGMSSGATLSAIEEAKTKGYSDDEATIRGLVSGAIEYVTEKVGMDGVFAAVKEGKGALMALVKSGLAEGSEELVGNQLDRLTTALMDAITGKSVTETQKEVRKYIAQGMSEEEAMQQVILDNVDEDIEAFASAFFSAGMSAAGYGALTGVDIREYVNQNIDNIIDSDNNIVDQEALEGLIETGMSEEFSKSTQRKAEALQQKLANGEEITQKEVKSLYTENVKETRSDRFEDTDVPEQTTAESLKTPSNLAELIQREQTSRNYANLKETLGSEGQKLFDNAINEAIQNRADRSQAVREVTNVYNAGAGVTDTYTATHLTAETRQALYKAGVADRSTYAAQEATNRLVRNMNAGVQKSDIVKQAIRDGQIRNDTVQSLDRLGKALGTRYEIHASSKDYNGQYDPGSATIHLFLDSNILKGEVNTDKIIRATVGHELTHRMQSLSSKHYEALTQSVVQAMGANRFNSAIAEYRAKAPNLSNAQLQDEVVADFIGKEIFTDETFIDRMVNGITNSDMTVEEKKTGLQKLKDIFSRIRNWLTGNGTKAQIDRLREVEKRIDDVLKAGIENLQNAVEVNPTDQVVQERFSMKTPAEETDRLIALHNMNEEAVKGMLELGGLAMPSVAITRADMGHTTYGDISVVYGKDSISPTNRQNAIYSGDAYTPTFPEIGIKVSNTEIKNIRQRLNKLFDGESWYRPGYSFRDGAPNIALDEVNVADDIKRYGSFAEAYKNNELMKMAFLKENGTDIKMPYTAKEYANGYDAKLFTAIANKFDYNGYLDNLNTMSVDQILSEYGSDVNRILHDWSAERYNQKLADKLYPLDDSKDLAIRTIDNVFRETKEYFDDKKNGNAKQIDRQKLTKRINNALSTKKAQAEFESWLNDVGKDVIEKRGVRNDKDVFTPSGNRRSFEQLYYDYSLANIVRAMSNEAKQGKTGLFTGGGNIRGASAKTFASVEEARKDIGRLTKLDYEEGSNPAIAAFDKHTLDLCTKMVEGKGHNSFFGAMDAAEVLVEVIPKHKTADAIYRYLVREGYDGYYNVTREIAQEIEDVIKEAQNLPTSYFEGKMYRAVPITEALAYVVPKNMDANLKQQLRDAGGNVIEYKSGDNTDRLKKVNSVEGARFSVKDSDGKALTPAQQEYFKDSKVRDEDGNLKVMYHGTMRGGFTVFDSRYSDDKLSLFFTDDPEVARTYTHDFGTEEVNTFREGVSGRTLYPVYLNITNPMVIDAKGAYWSEIQNGETETYDVERQTIGDFAFARKADADAFDQTYGLSEMYRLRDEARKNGEVEWQGDMADEDMINDTIQDLEWEAEKDYRGYFRNNATQITAKEFFDNYKDYGWYDLESLQDTYDSNGLSLDEIREYSDNDYAVAVAQMKEAFEDQIADGELDEDFFDTFKFRVIPRSGEQTTKRDLHSTRWYAQQAKANGNDGVIISNVIDRIYGTGTATVCIAFDSEQVKSVDNANPTTNPDIRYSRKNAPQLDFKTAVQLQEINNQLKGEVERLRTEFKRRPIDVKDFSQRITRTIREYQGTVDAQEIIDSMLPSAREFMKNPNKSNEAKLYGVIQDAAHRIITTALARDEFSEAAQVKEFLKGRRIKISPKTQSDFGDWMRDYHRRYFGNIYFTTNKGTSVEDTYTELQQQFGEGMFPSYIQNPTAQLERILEIYEAAESYSNPYDGMTAEAIESLEMQLVADVMDTTVKHTYADKQYEKREQLRKEMQEKMNDRIAQIRAERDQKFADLKAHYREVAENARERRSEREIRHRLLNVAQRLERVKTTAANRALIESLIGDLDTISMGMTGQGFENLQNLSRWYDSIMEDPDFVRDPNIEEKIKRLNKKHINGITRSIGTYATMADAKLAQQNYDGDGTTNIRKTPDGYVVTAHEDVMSIEDVRDLLDVLLNVENEIQTAKHLIDVEDRRDTFAMAQQIVEDIRQSAGVKDVTAMFDRYIVQGTLSPERAIHRYTGYVENDPLYLATKNLSSGQRNMLDYQYRANKKFLKFTEDGKFMDEITGKKAKALKYKMTNIQGNEVEVAITPAMRISLYLHSLNPQNLRHIVVGGLTIPTWKDYTKGKLTTAYAGGTVVRLTPSEIRSITSQMTTKEMALAREVYNYFNGMSQDAINAVSEKLKGYALARVSDYFPINTDDNFLHKEFGKLKENGTIQGMGFLQERNKKAVNPVRLRDVTDVLKQSIDMTSKYVGLAIPVSNINKLLNAQAGVWDKETETWKVETAVKKELSLKWKDKSIDYIEKLIGDLQNPINTQEDLDKVLSKVRSNYAGAVLTLNLSVAMKQAASYPTAAAVVGWKPLAKAMTQFGSVDLDLIARYTPLQWYRTQGYSTQELGDIKSRGKLMSNLPKALNWIQAVDLATTRKLWKAAEIYVQENNKALSVGTDEYYKTVAEIYNQIIEETQPNYTTMQRPEMLRSNSPMIQAISMFKTQPFQNFNITFDAVANYLAKKTADKNLNTEQSHAEFLKAQKRLSWAVTSQVAQLFTFAAMTLLWNALRGKWKKYKDKDGNLNAGTVTTGVAKDMASSLFSEVPFGAEAWGFISSKLFGDTYYGFDSVSVSALNDMVSAFSKAGTAISDFVGKDDEDEKDEKKRDVNSLRLSLDSAAKAITKVFGIPYENVENLFNIGFMNIAERLAPAFGGNKYEGHMAYLRLTVDPNKYKSDYYDNLIAAYENDKEAYKGIYDEMVKMDAFATSTKTAEENITAKVDEYMQEKYNLKVKPSKYEGVKPETLQKISEALVKADANNADETKRNESFDQNEIYNALMELALDKQTTEKVWEIEYGGKTSWDEYASKQETKAEAAEDRNKALDKVGLTPEDFETYISSMDSVTQANAYDVLKNSNFTTTQRRTLWTLSKDTPWSKTYDEYEKSQQKKTTKKQETKKEEPKEEPKEETRNDVGYTSVSSSVLSGYEYHNGVLTVTLNSGRTYSYNVSQETFDAFEAADSKGSFWNNYIK